MENGRESRESNRAKGKKGKKEAKRKTTEIQIVRLYLILGH
jgi:hypothetical protein